MDKVYIVVSTREKYRPRDSSTGTVQERLRRALNANFTAGDVLPCLDYVNLDDQRFAAESNRKGECRRVCEETRKPCY